MIKFHLVVAAIALVMIACTVVVDCYRLVMMMMVVIVVMIVIKVVVVVVMIVVMIVVQISICRPSSSILLAVEVQRRTHRRRVWRIDDRALLFGRQAGLESSVRQRSYGALGVYGRCCVGRPGSGKGRRARVGIAFCLAEDNCQWKARC